MTKNKWYIVIAVVIAAAVVGWLIWGRTSGAPGSTASPSPTLTFSPLPNGGTFSPASAQPDGNRLGGTLKISDNLLRGNLMLMAKVANVDSIIYIRTARDFTTLLDKEVVVTYDGTIETFILLNITEK